MTYIWNRVDRVPEDKVLHVVEECFKEWEKKLFKNFDKLNDVEKFRVQHTYSTQLRKKNINLYELK